MPSRITADVLEAFLHCRYKGHLRQAGRSETPSEYEAQGAEQRAAVRRRASHAAGLVRRLLDADTAPVPVIVGEMAEYRPWVDPLLAAEAGAAGATPRQ